MSILVVPGGETAGSPFATGLTDNPNLPMHCRDKKPNSFGHHPQIEGNAIDSKRILPVEDLIADDGCKIWFCEAIRKAGAQFTDKHAVPIQHFPATHAAPEKSGLCLPCLATRRDVLTVSNKQNCFNRKPRQKIRSFLDNPLTWSGVHDGATETSTINKKDQSNEFD